MPTGMGQAPLSCTEIEAWQRCTQTRLEPWEFSLIRSASNAYVIQSVSDDTDPPHSEQPHMKPVVAGAFKALAQRLKSK